MCEAAARLCREIKYASAGMSVPVVLSNQLPFFIHENFDLSITVSRLLYRTDVNVDRYR